MKIKNILILSLVIVLNACCGFLGYFIGNANKHIIVDFQSFPQEISSEANYRYKSVNMDYNLSNYVEYLCQHVFDVDSDLVVSLGLTENPKFDPYAINRNTNGSIDGGLFQLNSKYVYTDFLPRYGKDEFKNVEFDIFDWRHNTYIAIAHISWLKKHLKSDEKVIMAYNCGYEAVKRNKIPKITRNEYYPRVKKYLDNFKANNKINNNEVNNNE